MGWAILLVGFLVGCEQRANVFAEKEQAAQQAAQAVARRKQQAAQRLAEQQRKLEAEALRGTTSSIEREYQRTQSSIRGSTSVGSSSGSTYRGDTTAARLVLQKIRETVDLDRTMVVWIFDVTPSALRVTEEIRRSASDYYNSGELKAIQTARPEQLVSAVVSFTDQPTFYHEAPTADAAEVRAALEKLSSGSSEQEATFATLQTALERYQPLAQADRRRLVIVLATDEAGNDADLAEQIVPVVKKQEIPVYIVGVDAPWGSANPYPTESTDPNAAPNAIYGPESLLSERVLIELPVHNSRYGTTSQLIDSGFGPFALEWIARSAGGAFISVRPSGSSSLGGKSTWPTGSEQHFDPGVMKKYTPDYLAPTEYRQFVASNKARQALIDAAQLPRATVLTQPTTSFVRRNEADLKKRIMSAQKDAARVSPQLEKLVEVLSVGEGDRAKLTEPRWQASYDLAYGRALAARVRAEGYNAMLAALSRGKNFENEGSNTWYLEPADTIDVGSLYQKMADKAHEILQRVVREHPQTPWAKEAEEDLRTPLGWKWSEG